MKTKQEPNARDREVETLNRKLAELTEEEMRPVTGGAVPLVDPSEKTRKLIPDDDGPTGTYEVPEEGAEDPNARSKSLGL